MDEVEPTVTDQSLTKRSEVSLPKLTERKDEPEIKVDDEKKEEDKKEEKPKDKEEQAAADNSALNDIFEKAALTLKALQGGSQKKPEADPENQTFHIAPVPEEPGEDPDFVVSAEQDNLI